MKKLVALLVGMAMLLMSVAAAAAQPLLTPAELQSLNSDAQVRVIDIRTTAAYKDGHIAGAVSAPYADWRGPSADPGKLPSREALQQLVQRLGLTADSHAVVVSSGNNATNFGAMARVYWTLKYVGLSKLSILNGGQKAWVDAGLPLDKVLPSVTPSSYQVTLDKAIIANTQAVKSQLGKPQTQLVDARPHNYFEGLVKSPVVKLAGTIKGAVNVENGKWFKPGTAIFVSPERATEIASQLLPEPKQETISFCNTGHWAATDWFALSEVVGLKNVRLYPQSLVAWADDTQLPMDNVPSRGTQLLNKVKGLFD